MKIRKIKNLALTPAFHGVRAFPSLSQLSHHSVDLVGALAIVVFALVNITVGQSDQSNVKSAFADSNDNGNLTLSIPMWSFKGRGIDLPIALSYSSDVWKIEHLGKIQRQVPSYSCCITQSVTQAIYSKYATAGWRSGLALPVLDWNGGTKNYDSKGIEGSGGACPLWIREVDIHMPDGSTHVLRKTDQPSQSPAGLDQTGIFYAIDGSRIRFDANGTADTGTIYMPDGGRYVLGHPYSYIYDRNGNYLMFDESSRQWTDTLGRTIVDPLPASPAAQDYTYDLPGLTGVNNGIQRYVFKWRNLADVLTPDGNNQTPALKVVGSEALPNPSLPPSSSNFPVSQGAQYSPLFKSSFIWAYGENGPLVGTLIVGKDQAQSQLFNPVVLSEVVMPDGTSYKFTYNVYGEIDKIVYPTAAYEAYQFAGPQPGNGPPADFNPDDQQPYIQQLRALTSKKQSVDGLGDDIKEWQFNIAKDLDGGGSTTITAPDGTTTVTTLNGPGPKTSVQTGQGGQVLVDIYPFGFRDARVGMPASRKVYAPTNQGGGLLRSEIYDYEQTTQSYPIVCSGSFVRNQSLSRTPRLLRTTSIILEGSGNALAQSTTYSYDLTNEFNTGIDQTLVTTYHYVVIDNATAQAGDTTQIPLGTLAKYTESTFLNSSAYRNANILGLPTSVQTTDATLNAVVSRSEMAYDEAGFVPTGTTRALPTSSRAWDSTKGAVTNPGSYIVTHATFDQYGNRTIATDALGYQTTTTYDPNYHAFPTSVSSPIPDSTGVHGSNSAFVSSITYDSSTPQPLGLVMSTTDSNGQTTTMEYNDPLLRPTKVTAPNGAQTITQYGPPDSNHVLSESQRWVKVKTQIDADNWSEARSFYDGVGRTYKTQKTDTTDPDGDIFTLTCYDEMGRVSKTSNPYRNPTNESHSCINPSGLLWTTPEYDDLSRTKKITSPDSNDSQVTFGLSTSGIIGTTKTITDQAGRKRTGITDALGNMVRVIEDPDGQNLSTDYVFDKLGNLRKITQGGQVRYFTYDSLGRVLRAKQVEQDVNSGLALPSADPITNNNSWTIGYSYDDNGNITSTTNARGEIIYASYDRLNRLYLRDYSDPTMPDVSFYYDGNYPDPTNPSTILHATGSAKGKTTGVVSSVSQSNNTSFDSLGRLLTNQQITDGQTYNFGYKYNLSGALLEETYPSGRIVKNTLDSNGELEQVQSKKNSNTGYWTYADSFSYSAAGAVTAIQLGNGHWETAQYNSRLQVEKIGLGTRSDNKNILELDFGYAGPDPTNTVSDRNNGSLRSQTIKVPAVGTNAAFDAMQTYTYDTLNRIKSATETIGGTQTWKQTFDIDRYGNRRFDTAGTNTTTIPGSCSTAVCNPTFDTDKNRFSTGQGYSYDSDGAVTQDPTGQRFGYDSEDRQKELFSATNSGSTPDATYLYDGNGLRVKKISATETTVFLYDASSKLVAEYSSQAATNPQVNYLTSDHLGSPRIVTDQNGAVTSRKDFTAFGETVASSQRVSGINGNGYDTANVRQDYTGYQKDGESGLEYAQARYFNAEHGRFTSADPFVASASIRNPQTLNRYSYVINSPYKFTDPLGLALSDIGIVQTTDGFEARRAEQQSLRDYQLQINEEYKNAHPELFPPPPPPPKPTAEQNKSAQQTNGNTSGNTPKTDGPGAVSATVKAETIGPNSEQVSQNPATFKVGTMATFLISITGEDGQPFEGTATEEVQSKVNNVSTNTKIADEIPIINGEFRDIFAPPGLVTMPRAPTQAEIDAASAPMETKPTRLEQTATFTINNSNTKPTLMVIVQRTMTNVDVNGNLRNPNNNNTRFVLFRPTVTVIQIPRL